MIPELKLIQVPKIQQTLYTHPFTDAIVPPVVDDLNLLPEDAVAAPASDVVTSLYSKYQQDNEGNKHQEAQDDCNGLQETHDSANSCEKHNSDYQNWTFPFICVHCSARLAKYKW